MATSHLEETWRRPMKLLVLSLKINICIASKHWGRCHCAAGENGKALRDGRSQRLQNPA